MKDRFKENISRPLDEEDFQALIDLETKFNIYEFNKKKIVKQEGLSACLGCGNMFKSKGKYNRQCKDCRKLNGFDDE